MGGQFREVIRQRIIDSVSASPPAFTRRDVRLPAVHGKAAAVIGMRRAIFLLDEIQSVPGWERFARRLLDSEQVDLFLSGSSARLLSREVATSMRGRAMEALVRPFSFRECLRHRRREPDKEADRLSKAQRSSVEKDLVGYLAEGRFPEA